MGGVGAGAGGRGAVTCGHSSATQVLGLVVPMLFSLGLFVLRVWVATGDDIHHPPGWGGGGGGCCPVVKGRVVQHGVSTCAYRCRMVGDPKPGTRQPLSCWQKGTYGLVLATDEHLFCAASGCPRTAMAQFSTRG